MEIHLNLMRPNLVIEEMVRYSGSSDLKLLYLLFKKNNNITIKLLFSKLVIRHSVCHKDL